MAIIISSISGGIASAVATQRAFDKYGKDNVLPWFADPLFEDEDLYRFLSDLEKHWQKEIYRHVEGETPLQVSERHRIIANQKLAPCSGDLKVKPFTRFVKDYPKPVVVVLGLGWEEQHRMKAPKENYEKIEGVTVEYPLMWKPYDFTPFETVKSWGIEIPRLYQMGFPHNNCGGRCFRQGIKEWQRLKVHFPERFEQVRDWEQVQRRNDDARQNYAICRDQSGGEVSPLTLLEIEQQEESLSDSAIQEDMFACFCSY